MHAPNMNTMNIENYISTTSVETVRPAGTDFAAEQSADGSFDEQLRMAIEPAGGNAPQRPESPRNGEESEKTKGDDEPVVNTDGGEGAGNADKTESEPNSNEPGSNEIAGQNVDGDETQRNEMLVADADPNEMPVGGSGLQEPRPDQQPEPARENSAAEQPATRPALDQTATKRDAAAKTGDANRREEDGEEVEKTGLSQNQAPRTGEGELNAGETAGEDAAVNPVVAKETNYQAVVEENKPNAAAAEESATRNAAMQSQAVAAVGENKETSKQEKNRRTSQQAAQNVDEAGKQAAKSEPIVAGDPESASDNTRPIEKTETITSAVAANSDMANSDMGKRDMADGDMGDSKAATSETNPATTALAQRVAGGRETQTAAPSQTAAGEENDPLDRVRFVQWVARAFEAAGRDGGTLRIRLHPSELGSLRLEVVVRDGAMTARLETETQAAKNVLLDNLPALRDRLEQQNIKIERFDIDYSGGKNGQSSQNAADSQQDGERLDGRPHGSQTQGDRESGAGESSETPRARRLGEVSQLDVMA